MVDELPKTVELLMLFVVLFLDVHLVHVLNYDENDFVHSHTHIIP